MPRLPALRHPVRLVVVAVGFVVVVVVFGSTCSAPASRALPPPSSTSSTEPEATTTSVDHSRTLLEPLPGRTTTTLTEVGDAVLSGIVEGPQGRVAGAVVRVERLVGDAVQLREARTGQDGTFVLEGVPGGRLRVRAFAPPSLTMLEPDIFFLADGDQRDLRLAVREHAGLVVLSDVTPRAPTAGSNVSLAVRVLRRVVDEQGIARTEPIPGVPLQLSASGWVFLNGQASTGGDGVAVFTFRCEQATSVSASVSLSDGGQDRSYPLDVPSCGPRPTTTTTTSTTTTEPDGTTTSSAPTTTEGD